MSQRVLGFLEKARSDAFLAALQILTLKKSIVLNSRSIAGVRRCGRKYPGTRGTAAEAAEAPQRTLDLHRRLSID